MAPERPSEPMTAVATPIDGATVKKDFPIFRRDTPLVYLDSAATSQKPQAMLDAMERYYESTNANVHRGVYAIAEEATAEYEGVRRKVARFIGAPSERSVVFTKNTTEAVNLVAHSWARTHLRAGDAVLLTEMEHHANIVPWLMLREERGIELRYVPIGDDGKLILDDLDELLDGVSLFGFTAMSNVLGTLNPVRHLCDAAHAAGAVVLVDGAQYVPHLTTDVSELGCDFLAFSGHKMCGPTGIGVLWAREELLDAMPAFLGGGEMIRDVRLDGWLPNDIPWKFEAGTPPIAEAVGLGAAIDYLKGLGMPAVREHEMALTEYALRSLQERHGDDIRIFGPPVASDRGGVISFDYKGIHPHDVSQVLDQAGICVRAGHHCAKPLMRRLGVGATARASFYVYNDPSDVDALSESLGAASDLFLPA
ncbi:MAG TPA: SufS family cysteine desulfurase [Acidimicrobiales bacterium]|nr:SufS family cysteine desulfurase [Acidimicrobiales bacterium]